MIDSSSVLCLCFTGTTSKLASSSEFPLLLSVKNYAKLDLLKWLKLVGSVCCCSDQICLIDI